MSHARWADASVLACVTQRTGGVSTLGGGGGGGALNVSYQVNDDPVAVDENRARLAHALEIDVSDLHFARQVHGNDVLVVDGRSSAPSLRDSVGDADALVTATAGIVLGVLAADCVPVLLFDPVRHVVGVAHAGWRGTVAKVAARTVATMQDRFGCRPADLLVTIGPSIGPSSYEVGGQVILDAEAAFVEAPHVVIRTGDRTVFDLWEANRVALIGAGVDSDHIDVAGIDTYTNTDQFFSHRADQPTGRFCALIGLRRG